MADGSADLQRTAAIQNAVGNPRRSAWVSANAGTGKTYLLVRRVIRQLLAGSPPYTIVCITFTKAAASEMADRLLILLSEWALMPDDDLIAAIVDATGERPQRHELPRARRLFAQALETPGGLKIQTIHSFCASLLGRFPAEAGLTLGFRALEDDEAALLLRDAVHDVAEAAADPNHPLHEHLMAVAQRFQGETEDSLSVAPSLEDALATFSTKSRGLLSFAGLDASAISQALREAFGLDTEDSHDTLQRACREGLDLAFIREVIAAFSEGGAAARKFAAKMEAWLEKDDLERFADDAFVFKADGELLSRVGDKASKAAIHNFDNRWADLGAYFASYRDRVRAARILEENEHFMVLALACITNYDARKTARGGLDFDDLIEASLALLQNVDASWVRFKLDQGIRHVLLDEAQDTSLAQWNLFAELVSEVTDADPEAAGVDDPSTLFVVGDPKQSIYAFNGAEAALFDANRAAYDARLAGRLVTNDLFLSFRTAQPVLDVVDQVFAPGGPASMASSYVRHRARWSDRGGSVELWPSIEKPEKAELPVWDLPVDLPQGDSIDRLAAKAIAADICRRLDAAERLACKGGRAIGASDVMVLFQRRSARFREVIRALDEASVPCAGTDRIRVGDDVAVRDLIALLRFACNTDDCLSLAELLRSPFFGFSEDELFDVAHNRGGSRLWRALRDRAEGEGTFAQRCIHVADELQRALNEGNRRGPYALMTSLLDAGDPVTGRRRMMARLGHSFIEPVSALLDDALAFEDAEPRSLHGFLHRAETMRAEIKREVSDEGSGVRVMTVHGAKGLEAPAVYLADADYVQSSANHWRREAFTKVGFPDLGTELPILLPQSSKEDCTATAAWREAGDDARLQEYQRLFYVAATRAEEALTICGGKPEAKPESWYALAGRAFEGLKGSQDHTEQTHTDGHTLQRYARNGEMPQDAVEEQRPTPAADIPDWIHQPAADEPKDPVLYPSALGGDHWRDWTEGTVASATPSDAKARGLLVHKLLELLPDRPESEWAELADTIAARFSPVVEETNALVADVLALLADPSLA
ncbi:MAG: UvrD-helicase domain-containing protein, partial [Pseudomonadota bacterium]